MPELEDARIANEVSRAVFRQTGRRRLQRVRVSYRKGTIWAADTAASITKALKGLRCSDSVASHNQPHCRPFRIATSLGMGRMGQARFCLLMDQMPVDIQPPMPSLAYLVIGRRVQFTEACHLASHPRYGRRAPYRKAFEGP